MEIALVIFSLLTAVLYASAQPPDTLWTRSYPELGLNWPADAMVTPDGDIVVTGLHGMYPDSSAGWANLFVAKFDGEGNLLWNTEVEGEVDRMAAGKGICMAHDGNYMVYGKHDTLMQPYDGTHAMLLKMTPSGLILWRREYNLGLDAFVYDIQPTLDGCYILGGGEAEYNQAPHGYLLKVNEDGDSLWAQIYDSDLYGEYIVCTQDSGYGIAGRLGGGPTVIGAAKTDALGNKEWEYEYGGDGRSCGIAETPDSGLVVGGVHWYPYIMKVNRQGDLVWEHQFEPSEGVNNLAEAMIPTADGGFPIGGESVPDEPGPGPVQVVKVNAQGQMQWIATRGTGNSDQCMVLCPANDDGFVAVGVMTPLDNVPWYGMLEILRFGPSQPNHAAPNLLYPQKIGLEQNVPNPFNPTTVIAFDLPKTIQTRLVIYDVLGREVARPVDGVMSAGHHVVAFEATNQSSGTYFYALQAADKTATRRMMLLK
jgi:hypothetical protein